MDGWVPIFIVFVEGIHSLKVYAAVVLGDCSRTLGDNTFLEGDGVRPRAPIATSDIMSWRLSVRGGDTGAEAVGAGVANTGAAGSEAGAGTADGGMGPTESHPGGAVVKYCNGTVLSCCREIPWSSTDTL